MLIRTHNAIKNNPKDQLHVQHSTNAKYTKYLHLGYKILLGHMSPVHNILVKNFCIELFKVVIYNIEFCWLIFCAKFDCNVIQFFVPCIYYGISL